MRLLIAMSLLAAIAAAPAYADNIDIRANDVLPSCRDALSVTSAVDAESKIKSPFFSGFCMGMVSAMMQDQTGKGEKNADFCYPDGASVRDAIALIVKEADENRATIGPDDSFYDMTFVLLSTYWPCKK